MRQVSLFLELGTFSFICVLLPVPTVFKKYSNGLNIWCAHEPSECPASPVVTTIIVEIDP